jgi:hypothetical protein
MNNPMMFTDPSGYRHATPQERGEYELNMQYIPTPYWEGRYPGGYMNNGGGGPVAWNSGAATQYGPLVNFIAYMWE